MTELAKTFEPGPIEARWYAHWEGQGLFRPERPEAEPFTIVMPPPNVTGSLHIGHALDNTLQDILIRRERMRGKDSLWVVGTDHAGIATQMVVERNLEERQDKRTNYNRDEFVAKVWEWKAQSGGQITRQLRRLGASCDWSNERFTMDPGFASAVAKVFVELYKRGLAYRDKRLVNWDPKFQTAISDLEVETREVAGHFWHLKYPLADGSGAIHVATTRPETMLADMAVAVHPDDERYRAMVGKEIRHPITGRLIPIIPDEHADPELGSGAVKITPGHDFNDFEVGRRAGIKPTEMLNMFDQQARVVQTHKRGVPEELIGLDRFEARKKVIELLEAEGALEKVEERIIPTPYGDRSGVVIEPWLTDQWYVNVAPLAEKAMAATRAGEIRIVPETWSKTWFNWLENIQPWCVSRQLWWGHRIPAWHGPAKFSDGKIAYGHIGSTGAVPNRLEAVFVAENEDEVRQQAIEFYNVDGLRAEDIQIVDSFEFQQKFRDRLREEDLSALILVRDKDVLDTWFSSALWPFATLGWPDDAEETTLPLDGGGQGGGDGGDIRVLSGDATPPPTPPHQGEESIRRWTPKPGTDLARHYPNDVLISGFDILFFWDARMAMQGIEFMDEVPWKTLYLHGLVRDAHGQKMSKSKGNTVDPLGLIDKYGADALRFTLAAMESQGRDIKLDEKRVEGYRNFATKLWNAARFLQGNGVGASTSIAAPEAKLPVNRWIIGEVVETLAKLNKAFDELRFDGMADAIYHFTWGTFCDWYVELVKPILSPSPSGEGKEPRSGEGVGVSSGRQSPTPNPSPEGEGRDETRAVAAWVFDQILVMLHPFMPFVTEQLWHSMGERPYELIVAKWPAPGVEVDLQAKRDIEWLIKLVMEIRSARTELNVPPAARPVFLIVEETIEGDRRRHQFNSALKRLARIEQMSFDNDAALPPGEHVQRINERVFQNLAKKGAIQIAHEGLTAELLLEGIIDLDAEHARLSKAAAAAEKERDSLAARLANPAFTERAKPEAVDKARADHDARAAEAERLSAALARLG